MARFRKTVAHLKGFCFQFFSRTKIQFRCNVCGKMNYGLDPTAFGRENVSCGSCGSTVRMRAIVHLLSVGLFGRSMTLPSFPVRHDISGIGLSDWEGYAVPLSKDFHYRNTFYHKEPRLDITEIDYSQRGKYDFIISSDVLEHVIPPVSKAFQNTYALLKPGGILIFTVPFIQEGETIEHFPNLYRFEVQQGGDGHILVNHTREGNVERFSNLVFHGGLGSTLEMRMFSRKGLLRELEAAGFYDITVFDSVHKEFGIFWPQPWSLPLIAKKPNI